MGRRRKSGVALFAIAAMVAHLTTPSRASALPSPSPRAATITAASPPTNSAAADGASGGDGSLCNLRHFESAF